MARDEEHGGSEEAERYCDSAFRLEVGAGPHAQRSILGLRAEPNEIAANERGEMESAKTC